MMIRKIMLLGEIGVGKTSIARRLVFDKFGDIYKATIGADILRYQVEPPPQGIPFQFLIWDTDGSHGEAIFRQFHAQNAEAAMIVSDVMRPSTFDTMLAIGAMFAEVRPGRYFAHVLNKLDLTGGEPPPDMKGRLAAAKVPWFGTSAKTGSEVRTAFHSAANAIIKLEA